MAIITQAQFMTVEELLRLPEDGLRHELVRGELRSYPLCGAEHGLVAGELLGWLGQHIRTHHLGRSYATGTGFLLTTNPDTVRAPDAAFVSHQRLTAPHPTGYLALAPNLVAEVIAPEDTYFEVAEKVSDWLAAGSRMVLVINPRRRTVTVHRSPADVQVLTEADQLEGGAVVPGWVLPVRVLFGGEG